MVAPPLWLAVLVESAASIVILLMMVGLGRNTMNRFIIADWKVPLPFGAISATSNWFNTVAVFASGVVAFVGPWQFALFLVFNSLALVYGGILTPHVRRKGGRKCYSMAMFVGQELGPANRTVCALMMCVTLVLVMGFTLTALQQVIAQLQVWSGAKSYEPWHLSVAVCLGGMLLASVKGLPGVVRGADLLKFVVSVLLAGAIALLVMYYRAAVPLPVVHVTQAAAPSPGWIWYAVGLPFMASWMAGALSNPDLAERPLAIEQGAGQRAFFLAAICFGILVLAFGWPGFLAKDLGATLSPKTDYPVLWLMHDAIGRGLLPVWSLPVFMLGVLVAVLATMMSILTSAGNLFAIEVGQRFLGKKREDMIAWSRSFMVVCAAVAIMLAMLNVDLVTYVSNMGAVRGEMIFPYVVAAFFASKVRHSVVFSGIVLGFAGSIPLTFWNAFADSAWKSTFLAHNGRPLGALWAMLIPLAGCVVAALLAPQKSYRGSFAVV